MFHEEKMINGALHWRNTPDALWTPYSATELSFMLLSSRENARAQRMNSARC